MQTFWDFEASKLHLEEKKTTTWAIHKKPTCLCPVHRYFYIIDKCRCSSPYMQKVWSATTKVLNKKCTNIPVSVNIKEKKYQRYQQAVLPEQCIRWGKIFHRLCCRKKNTTTCTVTSSTCASVPRKCAKLCWKERYRLRTAIKRYFSGWWWRTRTFWPWGGAARLRPPPACGAIPTEGEEGASQRSSSP
jgi:hypothetical protein